jgi:hypothetical protein
LQDTTEDGACRRVAKCAALRADTLWQEEKQAAGADGAASTHLMDLPLATVSACKQQTGAITPSSKNKEELWLRAEQANEHPMPLTQKNVAAKLLLDERIPAQGHARGLTRSRLL